MSVIKIFGGLTAAALVTATLALAATPNSADANALARMHTLGMVHGKKCMINHAHKRNGRSNVSVAHAQQQAVKKWIRYTSAEYGAKWSNFHASWAKQMSCSDRGAGGFKKRFKCRLSAKPCASY